LKLASNPVYKGNESVLAQEIVLSGKEKPGRQKLWSKDEETVMMV
jgi:hypothetical protein